MKVQVLFWAPNINIRMKNTIWIFREERSGSSAFVGMLQHKLNMPTYFVDYEEDLDQTTLDHNTMLNTHHFPFLKDMHKHHDPLLIRTTRKNRTEQYLSELMVRWMMKTVYREVNTTDAIFNFQSDITNTFEQLFSKVEPTIIPKSELSSVHQMFSEKQKLWKKYANQYPNCTVYYEDLCEGIAIPLLGLTDCKLTSDLEIKKLPEYKQRVFLNYDMLVRWSQELIDEDFG